MNENIKEFFNGVAKTYTHDDNPTIDKLLDSLMLETNSRILDLGCGKGILTKHLLNRGCKNIVALDISEEMMKYFKEDIKSEFVTFINGDFYEFDSEPFDFIICFDAYPHFMDADGFKNRVNLLLKNGGYLAIIHDIGRPTLNEHHKRTAGKVSRKLQEPKEEAKIFQDTCDIVAAEEADDYYKLIVKKR